jgi:hypothetical protein
MRRRGERAMRSRSFRFMMGVACVLLCAATGAANAGAAKPKPVLHLEAGGKALAPGAPVTVKGTSFTMESPSGDVSCDVDEFAGSMTTNLGKKDLVTLESGGFGGEGEEGTCSSTFGSPFEHPIVAAEMLPYELRLSSKGEAEVKSNNEGILLRLRPVHIQSGHGQQSCFYPSGKLKTKFATNGEPLVLNFTGVKFHTGPDSEMGCGDHGTIVNMSVALSSEGEPVTARFGL